MTPAHPGRSVAIVSLSGAQIDPGPRPGAFETARLLSLPDGDAPDPLAARRAAVDLARLSLPDGDAPDPLAARRAAVDLARQAGCGWMIALQAGEALADDAFELVAPALDLFDAIFGAAHLRGSAEAVARLSRLAFDSADRLPHALLNWWVPDSHLVRTEVAARILDNVAARGADNWSVDYLFDTWANARCMKSAQALLVLDDAPAPRGDSERREVIRRLAEVPVFVPVIHGDIVYHLPYTGRNAGIEREQTRGLFFEAFELEELRKRIGPGAWVIDIGANTGNHTVFFAGPMKAAMVMPLEPLPDAGAALRRAVERNGLDNVDLSKLGIGIADHAGRARLVFSERGGLGETRLVPDPSGDIVIDTLDAVITGPVDVLKIDVEGMEMNVLAGAGDVIRRSRPLIYIEIANDNTLAFNTWLGQAGYRVERVFTDKQHANYLIVPQSAGAGNSA
jgi:FkbM family methyltransferase